MKCNVKKLLALAIAVSMCATLFAGCSSPTGDSDSKTESKTTGNDAKKDEVVSIQWYGAETFPQWMNDYLAKSLSKYLAKQKKRCITV